MRKKRRLKKKQVQSPLILVACTKTGLSCAHHQTATTMLITCLMNVDGSGNAHCRSDSDACLPAL